MSEREAVERFPCFGGYCAVRVTGAGPAGAAAAAAAHARARLLEWHGQFSRFEPDSELSRLNRDVRRRVPASPLMARLAAAARAAGERTGGLVDATLLGPLERTGYVGDLPSGLDLAQALALAPARRPAGPSPSGGWRLLEADLDRPAVIRPPGLGLDGGGLAKGLFADVLAATLAGHARFAVDCGGDLAVGGSEGAARAIEVESPFDGSTLHTYHLARTAVATSGIGRRSWLGADGRPAHHLLDPATGRPAFTGVVQATALAPSAVLAEIHAKAALLSGPEAAAGWLPWGGLLVLDDGSSRLVEARRPRPERTAGARSSRAVR